MTRARVVIQVLLVVALVALAVTFPGCGVEDGAPPSPPPALVPPPVEPTTYGPGSTIDLDALLPRTGFRFFPFRTPRTMLALIGSPPGGYTWQFKPGWGHGLADAAGLALTGSLLHTPDCRLPSPPGWPFPIYVEAVRDGVAFFSITITVDERFIESKVACYLVEGDSRCNDPAQGITVEAGKTVQFYSLVSATCTKTYEPPLPDGACPASDPNFAFCR